MKKLISILLILTLLPYLTGCYSMNQISKTEFKETNKKGKIELKTKTGDEYQFEYSYFILSDTLYGNGIKISDGDETAFKGAIALDDILTINHEEYNSGMTTFLAASIIVVFLYLLLVAAANLSGFML